MSTAKASLTIPGATAVEVERLWCTPERWPEFVDGLASVGSADPAYPEAGSVVEWHSFPGGRGEVREIVSDYLPGERVTSKVEDDPTTAKQTVSFAEAGDGATVSIELEYEIRQRGPFTAVTDLLFVRRAQADSLRRTLAGLAEVVIGERT